MRPNPRPVHPIFFIAALSCLLVGLAGGVFVGPGVLRMPARLVRSELRSDDVVLLGIVFVAAVLVVCGAAMLFRSRVAAVVALVVTALAACLFLFLFLWMFLGPIPLLVLPVLAYLLAAGLALSKRDATGR